MTEHLNWPEFLHRHDMEFTSLPTAWPEAPHFGNAMIGSMLFVMGGRLVLEVFRADVHDHREESYGWTAYSRPRLRIGHFALETTGIATGCAWRKDLWNAELTGDLITDCGTISIRHFVHARDMAIVTRLTPSEGEHKVAWSWHPEPAESTRKGYPTNEAELERYAERYGDHHRKALKPPVRNPPGRLEIKAGVSVWVQDLVAGGQYATSWSERHSDDCLTHIATISNTFPERSAAGLGVDDVQQFIATDFDQWVDSHRAWWHSYYRKSHVSLPDPSFEALYWHTIYRYGCTARTGRSFVDTSGLWFQGGQWPYTTNDWNTQAAHWGVYAANRLEQGGELVERLHRHRDNLIESVHPEAWRDDCAYLTLATPVDFSGSRRGDMRYYDLVGGLPWLLHNAWWQYRYSMDEAMLRDKIFPLLRRAVNLYLHIAIEGSDGRIHLPPTYSPETGIYGDSNFDLALFSWGCHTLINSCKRLRIDDPQSLRWRDVIERLVDFPADSNGFMLASEQTAWEDHRHLSHLLMIYPLYGVNIEQDGVSDVINRTCRLACNSSGSDGLEEMEDLHAMVQTHAGPIAASVGDGDLALEGLERLRGELSPTGLWPCSDNPCIESSLSVANIIQNMLIQSWSDPASDNDGPIRVFPALPTSWTDVEFHDLRAEGAFLVSAVHRAGLTERVRIESLAGEPCRVRPGFDGRFRANGDREFLIAEISAGVYEIDLQKGETVELERTTATE